MESYVPPFSVALLPNSGTPDHSSINDCDGHFWASKFDHDRGCLFEGHPWIIKEAYHENSKDNLSFLAMNYFWYRGDPPIIALAKNALATTLTTTPFGGIV